MIENMIVKLNGGSVYHFRNVISSWIEGDSGFGSSGGLLTIHYKVDGSDDTEYARFRASHVAFAGDENVYNQQDDNIVQVTWRSVSELPRDSCWVLVGFENENTIPEVAHYNSADGDKKFRRAYTGEILYDVVKWMPLSELNG